MSEGEIILMGIATFLIVLVIAREKSRVSCSGPGVMCSRSEGIEGHYAFLEMHGFDSGRPKAPSMTVQEFYEKFGKKNHQGSAE